jgi:hypothetical protein
MTPIEVIAATIRARHDVMVIEVLVPEQCMMVVIQDKICHITIEEIGGDL